MTSPGIWSIESSTDSRLAAGTTSEILPVGGDALWFTVPSSEGTLAIVPVPADAREQVDGRVIFTSGDGDLQIVASRVSAAPDTSTLGRLVSDAPPTVERTYTGKLEADADKAFTIEARGLAARGYVPTTQDWAPGQWGRGAWIVAALLCLVLVGFAVLAYMLLVKPEGTLTVAYERRSQDLAAPTELTPAEATSVAMAEAMPTEATAIEVVPAETETVGDRVDEPAVPVG